ncbi:MAG: hypothetical protein GY913_30000 [Proteobacteria bacterium]|nr:hypothetical protein [Pseudomonadota bacterium]
MFFLLACLGEVPDSSTPESTPDSPVDSEPAVFWQLSITGDDYPHIGQQLGLNVIRTDTDELVAQEFLVFADNTFSLELGAILADGVEHHIDWYADADDSESCSDDDHAWTWAMLAATEDVNLALPHVNGRPFDIDNACSHF